MHLTTQKQQDLGWGISFPSDKGLPCGRRGCYNIWRRSKALSQLPGPEYPFVLGVFDMVLRKDVHRAATELAERYGPLVKLRLMSFHVRALAAL